MALLAENLSPVGFGAFKIGRNQGIKYESAYDLPDDRAVDSLLHAVLDMGINLIDTAPAYGISEERIGAALGRRRSEFFLTTKVGESFEDGVASYDFSPKGVRESVARSLRRLRTDHVDLLSIHAHRDDVRVLQEPGLVETLIDLRQRGDTRAIGFSGYTVEANRAALAWADALMVCYHPEDESLAEVMREASAMGRMILVKKGLSSGRIPPARAIPWILSNPAVTSVVIGSLSVDHLRENLRLAREQRRP